MPDAKELSRRIFEDVWNRKNVAAIDELMAAGYVHHDPQSPNFSEGIQGYKEFVAHYLNAFPDAHFTIDQEVQEADVSVTRWRVTGTHRGNLPALSATGKTFSVAGITIAQSKNGKIVESWNNWDALGLMQQLGGVSVETDRAA